MHIKALAGLFVTVTIAVLGVAGTASAAALTDDDVENLVQRAYQYVAMYSVNNKFALNPGGWNSCVADTALRDHTMTEIARPNNDTLYVSCMLDLRNDPIVLEMPVRHGRVQSGTVICRPPALRFGCGDPGLGVFVEAI